MMRTFNPQTAADRIALGTRLLSLLCLLQAACTSKAPEPLTEVLVQVFADPLVQERADQLTIEIASGASDTSQLESSMPEMFNLSAGGFRWPASLALVAKPAHADHVFELTLHVERRGEVIARGRVKSAFVKGQTLLLQTTLSAQCLGKLDCAADETCVVTNGRATCESATVDAGSLPRVRDTSDTSQAGSDGASRSSDASAPEDSGQTPSARDGGEGSDGSTDAAAGPPTQDAGSDASTLQDAGNPACVPLPERCDNNLDDDCDGAADCADSDCAPITECIPAARATVLVDPDQPCPEGFEPDVTLHQQPQDPGCEGCACKPEPKVCELSAFVYTDAATCATDQPRYILGTRLPDPITSDCSRPIGKQIGPLWSDSANGIRAELLEKQDSCIADGSPKPGAASWAITQKQCTRVLRHGGCGVGAFCAPKRPNLCWPSMPGECASPASARVWWESYEDMRQCEACACEASGGNCSDVRLLVDPTATCPNTDGKELQDGTKLCGSFPAETTVRSVGAPTTGDCKSYAPVQGKLVPTLPHNLCCKN